MSDELDLRTKEEVAATEVTDAQTASEPRELPPPEIRTVDARNAESARHEFKKSLPREYFESIVVTLIMALFGMTFIVQAVKVPTGSMKNTIWIQDHLLVNKFIFGPSAGFNLPLFPTRAIKRGDIVVFKYPEEPQTNFVKRVIGLPGETIEYRANNIYINGQLLPEHRVYVKMDDNSSKELTKTQDEGAKQGAQWTVFYYENDDELISSRFNDESGRFAVRQPYKIPVKGDPVSDEIRNNPDLERIYDADRDGRFDDDQYFCLGDNRDNSKDSRFWGTVPRNQIVGRAMFVYWSIDPEAGGNFFTNSRWWRTGKFIK